MGHSYIAVWDIEHTFKSKSYKSLNTRLCKRPCHFRYCMTSGGEPGPPHHHNARSTRFRQPRDSPRKHHTNISNPIAMAPSEKEIVAGMYAAVKALYAVDPETLTVRNVRNKVEADMGLEAGLLSNEAWKDKSKGIIKGYAVCVTLLPIEYILIHCV